MVPGRHPWRRNGRKEHQDPNARLQRSEGLCTEIRKLPNPVQEPRGRRRNPRAGDGQTDTSHAVPCTRSLSRFSRYSCPPPPPSPYDEQLLNSGVLKQINGVISTGKESNVYHATLTREGPNGQELPPIEVAIKVFKTTMSEFKNRTDCINSISFSLLLMRGC